MPYIRSVESIEHLNSSGTTIGVSENAVNAHLSEDDYPGARTYNNQSRAIPDCNGINQATQLAGMAR